MKEGYVRDVRLRLWGYGKEYVRRAKLRLRLQEWDIRVLLGVLVNAMGYRKEI